MRVYLWGVCICMGMFEDRWPKPWLIRSVSRAMSLPMYGSSASRWFKPRLKPWLKPWLYRWFGSASHQQCLSITSSLLRSVIKSRFRRERASSGLFSRIAHHSTATTIYTIGADKDVRPPHLTAYQPTVASRRSAPSGSHCH